MIVDVAILKQQLNATGIPGTDDDALIERKIEAAQNHIERLLGFKVEETYGGTDQDEIPPALVEAVCQLAAHWFENREATLIGVTGQELPFGVWQIVNEYREYSFG
ncbi:phage gp6-like head-tail connector protein [Rhizobium oryzihabitans]|uniref:Phage gp6-like head-tail connector protein n=1 Tax=Rhizobium oryzihabitans TaxID=2267833 RepID=A0A7L5BDT8_9HYPH|nr:head-tail connector protein [Rhizobium oryzihabitans]QIB36992.1 phage gp6-like head-tail connector protein [Rhizobium oryzihabitans]